MTDYLIHSLLHMCAWGNKGAILELPFSKCTYAIMGGNWATLTRHSYMEIATLVQLGYSQNIIILTSACCYAGQGPGTVEDLQVSNRTATTLNITWRASGCIHQFEVLYNYTVKRCSAPQGAPRNETISDGSMRSYTLTGLNEDSSYTITVKAINITGSTVATVTADNSTLSSGEKEMLYNTGSVVFCGGAKNMCI